MAASLAFASGTTIREIFLPRASRAIGSAPRTLRTPPSKESSHKQAIWKFFLCQAPVGPDYPECHGQIEAGTFLLDVSGRQIDGDLRGRNVIATVFQRRPNPVAALAHRCVGKSDRMEMILVALDPGAVHFHLDDVRVYPINCGAEVL